MSKESLDIVLKYFSDFTDKQVDQLRALEGLYADLERKNNRLELKW